MGELPLQVHAGREQKEQTPPPFDQIRFARGVAITGNEIYMAGNLEKEVVARIQDARSAWRHVNRMIFRNKTFNHKIKITIRYSLIRSAMTYGLHTKTYRDTWSGKWKYTCSNI